MGDIFNKTLLTDDIKELLLLNENKAIRELGEKALGLS